MPIIPSPHQVALTRAVEDALALLELGGQEHYWTCEDPRGHYVYENADVRLFINPRTTELTVDKDSDSNFIIIADYCGVKIEGR